MGVLIAQATLTWIAVCCTYSVRLSNSKRESFIDFIERLGASYPQSEGSGAKPEVYLVSATAALALRGNWKLYRRNFVTGLSVSLWRCLLLIGGRIIGLGLASALKHMYTLQHNPTCAAAAWLSTPAVYRCSKPRHAQRYLEMRT